MINLKKIECYNSHHKSITHLVQWDKNQEIYVKDLCNGLLPTLHFAHSADPDNAFIFNDHISIDTQGYLKIKVPNQFLESDGWLYIYLYYHRGTSDDPYTTKYQAELIVRKKPKPGGYIPDPDTPSNPDTSEDILTLQKEIGALRYSIQEHAGNQFNPHNVTASQIGLNNVDNTSDTDKPVSHLQQIAINEMGSTKVDKINGKGLSANDYTTPEKTKLANLPDNDQLYKDYAKSTEMRSLDSRVTVLENRPGGGGTGSSDYNLLANRPRINNILLEGNKSLKDLGIASDSDLTTTRQQTIANTKAISNIAIPVNVSELRNDALYQTKYDIDALLAEKDYATNSAIDSKHFATQSQLPKKTSDLENDSNFISSPLPSLRFVGGASGIYNGTEKTVISIPLKPLNVKFIEEESGDWQCDVPFQTIYDYLSHELSIRVQYVEYGNSYGSDLTLLGYTSSTIGFASTPLISKTAVLKHIFNLSSDNVVSHKFDSYTGHVPLPKLTFTGATTGSYDGTRALEINIPVVDGGNSTTNDYESLINKPKINGQVLVKDKSLSDLGIAAASELQPIKNDIKTNTDAIGKIKIPTLLSEFTNDTGYQNQFEVDQAITSKGYITADDIPDNVSSFINDAGYLNRVVIKSETPPDNKKAIWYNPLDSSSSQSEESVVPSVKTWTHICDQPINTQDQAYILSNLPNYSEFYIVVKDVTMQYADSLFIYINDKLICTMSLSAYRGSRQRASIIYNGLVWNAFMAAPTQSDSDYQMTMSSLNTLPEYNVGHCTELKFTISGRVVGNGYIEVYGK